MTQDEIIEMAIQGHASTRDAIRWAMNQEREQSEPVAFKIYKPTPLRHATPNVRDAELPWVYDQDPSSGNVASMWVTPVARMGANGPRGQA